MQPSNFRFRTEIRCKASGLEKFKSGVTRYKNFFTVNLLIMFYYKDLLFKIRSGEKIRYGEKEKNKIWRKRNDMLSRVLLNKKVGIYSPINLSDWHTGRTEQAKQVGARSDYSLFICGKRITSLMDSRPERIMVRRSIPNPMPPVGGRPYPRAFMKS